MNPGGEDIATGSRLQALLEISAVRYIAYYALPFIVAWSTAPAPRTRDVWLGLCFWTVFSFGVETANRLADRVEDEINQPERTARCAYVGYDRLARACVASWLLTALVAAAWLLSTQNLTLGAVLLIGAFAGLTYSYGLRTKRLRFGAAIAMTMPFCGAFLVGWATGHTGLEGVLALLRDPAIGVLAFSAVFSATLGPAKDITDGPGDAAVGYRSIWLSLLSFPSARAACAALLAPYAVALALVALGVLPPRFYALGLGVPIAIGFASIAHRAGDDRARAAVREAMYHYWFGVLTCALVLYRPTAVTLAAAIAAWLYWWCTTQTIHWSRGITSDRVSALSSLLRDWIRWGAPSREERGRGHDD